MYVILILIAIAVGIGAMKSGWVTSIFAVIIVVYLIANSQKNAIENLMGWMFVLGIIGLIWRAVASAI